METVACTTSVCCVPAAGVSAATSEQHAAAHAVVCAGMSGEELERLRVSSASGGLIGDVLDKCVQQVTGDNIKAVCEAVRGTLKCVGVTLVCCVCMWSCVCVCHHCRPCSVGMLTIRLARLV